MINKRKLTIFDNFCLKMIVKGAWIYPGTPDAGTLSASFILMQDKYPYLRGRYSCEESVVIWDGSEEPEKLEVLRRPGHTTSENMYSLVPEFDLKAFLKGKKGAVCACLLVLDDGCAIVVQAAHALMDASSFYGFVREWASLCGGKDTAGMVCDSSFLPAPEALTKEETLNRVIAQKWPKLGFSGLLRMFFYRLRFKDSLYYDFEIPFDDVLKMKATTGMSVNSLLCYYALSQLVPKDKKARRIKVLEVIDLRGRASGFPENFIGNCAQAFPVAEIYADGVVDLLHCARSVQEGLSCLLEPEKLDEMLQLTLSASYHKLPYFSFDPTRMNAPGLEIIYVNNQLKFRAAEIDFGQGLPLRVQQAELPDMIKFWQEAPGGPVKICYSGYAAYLMKKNN